MPVDVVFLSDDLMFAPRVSGAVLSAGWTLREVGSPTAAITSTETDTPRLLIVDLETTGLEIRELLSGLPETDRPVVLAFGPHVHHQRLEAARDAGCTMVVSRGRFSSDLPSLLSEILTTPST
jgi:DNA-binding response OmpR family regulator